MQRHEIDPRPDWIDRVRHLGLLFIDETRTETWQEEAYYELTTGEVEELESSTSELHELCLKAVDYVIEADRFGDLGISPEVAEKIVWAWDADPPAIYGRFDLAYDGVQPPKMLEYNADTPTTLLEAAVVQWYWLQERFPEADQFNSIWEGLVEKWQALREEGFFPKNLVHLASADSVEDFMTITAVQDTASQAGLETEALLMEQIGWDGSAFVDLQGRPMEALFKLYPWEWIVDEEFGKHALATMDRMHWIEPIWKMVLSNKGLLPVLWEMNPGHPNLLPAYFDEPRDLENWVSKPLLGREGANVRISLAGKETTSGGEYGNQRLVYQGFAPLPEFDERQPLIGSWVIDGEARGIGIRESIGPITTNLSPFVPHLFC